MLWGTLRKMIRKTLQPRGLFLWQLNLGFGLAKSLRPQVRARKGAEWVDIAEFFTMFQYWGVAVLRLEV